MATNERTRETQYQCLAARERLQGTLLQQDLYNDFLEFGNPADTGSRRKVQWYARQVKIARRDLARAERAHAATAAATR